MDMLKRNHSTSKNNKTVDLILICLLILLLVLFHSPVMAEVEAVKSNNKPATDSQPNTLFSASIKGSERIIQGKNGSFIAQERISGHGNINASHIIFNNVISPGNSPGCITITGNATFNSSSSLIMEIGGDAPCSGYDKISVSELLTVNNASLNLLLINNFIPQFKQRFDILDWGQLSGNGFLNMDTSGATLPYPLQWDLSQIHITGEAVITVQMIADGDLAPVNNPDGIIDVADMLIASRLASGLITPTPLQFAHGDINSDGVIDIQDFLYITQQAVKL